MFKNYVKTAFRNIRRHKGYSFINIAGLAAGSDRLFRIIFKSADEPGSASRLLKLPCQVRSMQFAMNRKS